MFDMGFTEMMLIGIVALIVIGPERLPGVARTAGKYFGRLKRFMTTVKADVEQELRADELRQILADQQRELDTLKDSINTAGREIEEEAGRLNEAGNEIARGLEDDPAAPRPDAGAVAVNTAQPAGEPAATAASKQETEADSPAREAKS